MGKKERERERERDFGKPQAPEQKKRARFERKRNPNSNPAGPLSPQNLVCREASVTRNGSGTFNNTRALATSKRKRSFPSSRPFQQQKQQHGDERGAEEKHELQPQREVHHG